MIQIQVEFVNYSFIINHGCNHDVVVEYKTHDPRDQGSNPGQVLSAFLYFQILSISKLSAANFSHGLRCLSDFVQINNHFKRILG